jgi:hypothetical protein
MEKSRRQASNVRVKHFRSTPFAVFEYSLRWIMVGVALGLALSLLLFR